MSRNVAIHQVKATIWAYLIESGTVDNRPDEERGKWDFYGGFRLWSLNPDDQKSLHHDLLDKIASHGVNWDKTAMPKGAEQEKFQGTHSEHSRVETLSGSIHLNDGSVYHLLMEDAEQRFSDYAKSFMEFMSDQKRTEKIFPAEVMKKPSRKPGSPG